MSLYAPDFFTNRHQTPWGDAINFDGADSRPVRDFFIENARILDRGLSSRRAAARRGPRHQGRQRARTSSRSSPTRVRTRFSRPVHLMLENEDNETRRLVTPRRQPVFYTAQWNDDIHHVLHVAATGERGGYYGDFGDTRAPRPRAGGRLRLSRASHALPQRAARRPERGTCRRAPSSPSSRTTTRSATARSASV